MLAAGRSFGHRPRENDTCAVAVGFELKLRPPFRGAASWPYSLLLGIVLPLIVCLVSRGEPALGKPLFNIAARWSTRNLRELLHQMIYTLVRTALAEELVFRMTA